MTHASICPATVTEPATTDVCDNVKDEVLTFSVLCSVAAAHRRHKRKGGSRAVPRKITSDEGMVHGVIGVVSAAEEVYKSERLV